MPAPELYGLVLTGGQSTRMGQDKGELIYYEKPQREHVYDLLSSLTTKTFLSVNERQSQTVPKHFNLIIDTFDLDSPLNGILSAFKHNSEVAWLALACDMPYINEENISDLIKHRNPNKLATAYIDSDRLKPHPMFAIWESGCFEALRTHSKTSKSPREFLIQNDIELVTVNDLSFLQNVNSKTAFKDFKLKIDQKTKR